MSEIASPEQMTVFERVWQQEDGHLFKSEWHSVMVVVDPYPRMPLQVVVAPADGTPGKEQHFHDLSVEQQRKLWEVGMIVGAKIMRQCFPGQREMFTLEGFAVPDHAHIVYYAGSRGQGINRYSGPILGEEAVERTRQAMAFTEYESELLDRRLDRVPKT